MASYEHDLGKLWNDYLGENEAAPATATVEPKDRKIRALGESMGPDTARRMAVKLRRMADALDPPKAKPRHRPSQGYVRGPGEP